MQQVPHCYLHMCREAALAVLLALEGSNIDCSMHFRNSGMPGREGIERIRRCSTLEANRGS